MVEKPKGILEMKCANETCSNMIYISGSDAMGIESINAHCGDCQQTTTYKKKSAKATYVKRLIDGQMKLDESLNKKDDDSDD